MFSGAEARSVRELADMRLRGRAEAEASAVPVPVGLPGFGGTSSRLLRPPKEGFCRAEIIGGHVSGAKFERPVERDWDDLGPHSSKVPGIPDGSFSLWEIPVPFSVIWLFFSCRQAFDVQLCKLPLVGEFRTTFFVIERHDGEKTAAISSRKYVMEL